MLGSFRALTKRYSQWPHETNTERSTVCTCSNKEERRHKIFAHTNDV